MSPIMSPTSNRLSVNPSKTEFLLIGTPQQRSKLTSSTLTFQGTSLSTVSSCRNLGVILDNDLSFKRHISSVCSSSFSTLINAHNFSSSLIDAQCRCFRLQIWRLDLFCGFVYNMCMCFYSFLFVFVSVFLFSVLF